MIFNEKLIGSLLFINCFMILFHIILFLSIKVFGEKINQLYLKNKLRHVNTENIEFYHIKSGCMLGINIPFGGNFVYTHNNINLAQNEDTLMLSQESVTIFYLLMAICKSRMHPYKYILLCNIVIFVSLYLNAIIAFFCSMIFIIFFSKYDKLICTIYALSNMPNEDLQRLKLIYSTKHDFTNDLNKCFISLFRSMFTDDIHVEILKSIIDSEINSRRI